MRGGPLSPAARPFFYGEFLTRSDPVVKYDRLGRNPSEAGTFYTGIEAMAAISLPIPSCGPIHRLYLSSKSPIQVHVETSNQEARRAHESPMSRWLCKRLLACAVVPITKFPKLTAASGTPLNSPRHSDAKEEQMQIAVVLQYDRKIAELYPRALCFDSYEVQSSTGHDIDWTCLSPTRFPGRQRFNGSIMWAFSIGCHLRVGILYTAYYDAVMSPFQRRGVSLKQRALVMIAKPLFSASFPQTPLSDVQLAANTTQGLSPASHWLLPSGLQQGLHMELLR